MKFVTSIIKGKGIGKTLGFPTLNLVIPENLTHEDGIYAGWVWIDEKKYMGAFHLGPVPVFKEIKRSFEVFVLDAEIKKAPETVEVDLVQKLRDVMNFPTQDHLIGQMKKDVVYARKVLSEK